MDIRSDTIDHRLDAANQRMDYRFDAVNQRIGHLERRFERIESGLRYER
ncbi:MAG: hypothetical protein OXG90_09110 [Gammaproteobacteria bacterium]|nr:hypothetical protein [Gammaproteobacteria bacterium]